MVTQRDDNSLERYLRGLKPLPPPSPSEIIKAREQRIQDVHDLRLDIAPVFLKWIARWFFPTILIIVIFSGLKIEYKDSFGYVFEYKVPYLIASATIASSIISVAAVAGILLGWVFRSK